MAEETNAPAKDNSNLILWIGLGLLAVGGIFLLMSGSSSSSSGGSSASNTAAINGIVSSNENAQDVQSNEAEAYMAAMESMENNLVNANASVQENASNNATALSEANIAVSLEQIEAEESMINTETQTSGAEQVATTESNASTATSEWTDLGSLLTTMVQTLGAIATKLVGGQSSTNNAAATTAAANPSTSELVA